MKRTYHNINEDMPSTISCLRSDTHTFLMKQRLFASPYDGNSPTNVCLASSGSSYIIRVWLKTKLDTTSIPQHRKCFESKNTSSTWSSCLRCLRLVLNPLIHNVSINIDYNSLLTRSVVFVVAVVGKRAANPLPNRRLPRHLGKQTSASYFEMWATRVFSC